MIRVNGKTYKNVALIGLCSTTGPESGKSFAAKQIINLCATQGDVVSFATPLKVITKHMVKVLWGLDTEQMAKSDALPAGDKAPFTLRDFYIELGTGAVRENLGRDFWIHITKTILAKRLDDLESQKNSSPFLVVIDDVRFFNEFDFIIETGGQVFNVERQGVSRDTLVVDAGDMRSLPYASDLFHDRRTLKNAPHHPMPLLEGEILAKVKPIVEIMMKE